MTAIISALINLSIFIVVYVIRKVVNKEGIKSFLIHFDKSGRKLLYKGILLGIVFVSLYPIFIGLLSKSKIVFDFSKLLVTSEYFLSVALLSASVALLEEALFRGYILQKLLTRISYWGSIIILAIIFGGLHFFNYSSSYYFWIGLINASVVGILLSIWVVREKSLMTALGYHFSWNLFQKLITHNDSVFQIYFKESVWTGPKYLPETGLYVSVILVMMGIYTFISVKRNKLTPKKEVLELK